MPYGKHKVLLGNDSALSSTITSNAQLVDGYRQLSISIETSGTSTRNVRIYGTNAQGLDSALVAENWSLVTTIPGAGIYTVDPGMRWLQADRNPFSVASQSATSNTTVILQANVV